MSGLVGIFNVSPVLNRASVIGAMAESIKQVQSDVTDIWGNDNLRIARVHHNVVNREKQPIFNEDRSLLVMMDGEVFDYADTKAELVRKGHRFSLDENDAEFCLHLYEELGQDAFVRLNGSFILVLYDLIKKQLTIVNDRFCSLPLYYCSREQDFIFSTNFVSVLVANRSRRELNMEAVFEFLALQRVLGDKTYYKDIKWLPPATVLNFKDGNLIIKQYWEMKYCAEDGTEDYYANELAERLKKAIEIRTQDSNGFGLLLSGGLDSRSIVAACDKPMVTLSYSALKKDLEIAQRLASVKGWHHSLLDSSDMEDATPDIWTEGVKLGAGFHTANFAYMLYFAKQIRDRCKIVFHGNPPELFFRGSSIPHRKMQVFGNKSLICPGLLAFTEDNLLDIVLSRMKYGNYSSHSKLMFSEPYQESYDESLKAQVKGILGSTEGKTQNLFDRFTWFDTYYTSRYPSYIFQLSLRAFIDERTVFFDNDLLDLHLKIPIKFRSNNRLWNKALRKLNPKIAKTPDANTGYSPFMPQSITWTISTASRVISYLYHPLDDRVPERKSNRSIWPNYSEMIRADKRLSKIIELTIEDSASIDPSIFNVEHLRRIFNAHRERKGDYAQVLFRILTFGKWFKRYGPLSNMR